VLKADEEMYALSSTQSWNMIQSVWNVITAKAYNKYFFINPFTLFSVEVPPFETESRTSIPICFYNAEQIVIKRIISEVKWLTDYWTQVSAPLWLSSSPWDES
jgi:hypothetical protein